jgi:hypothetical protein
MFCLRDDGGFCSREHPIPEALGNHNTILEPGVVCDRCNNGPLAYCDGELVNCPPIALMRTSQGIQSKRGRVPAAQFGDAGIHSLGDGSEGNHLYLNVPDEAITDGDGSFELELTKQWTAKQASRASRAILKIGFEMLAWDNGKSYVMNERFDGLRKAILHGYRGWLAYSTINGPPSPEVTVHYPPSQIPGTSRWGLLGGVEVWGMRLTTMWPANHALLWQGLPDTPEVRNMRYLQFDLTPSNKADYVRMSVTVEYGSQSEWGDDMPFAEQVRRIDGQT